MTTLVHELAEDQKLMVEAIYSSYSTEGKWPKWRYVKRWFRQRSDSDPKMVRDSVPVVGIRSGPGPSYSVIKYNPHDHGDSAEYRLCLAAGLHISAYSHTTQTLVDVIRFLANGMKTADPTSGDITITRNQLARAMNWDPFGMGKIPDLLHAEPLALITSSNIPDDGNWAITLGDDGLIPYSGVNTLRGYVEKTVELITALAEAQVPSNYLNGNSPSTVEATEPSFVSEDLIDQLEGLQTVDWHLGKFIAMLRELNAAYAARHQYSSLMLCRAIMDHVPPIFGCAKFSEVASQVSMGVTDKNYLKVLGNNRFVSDDTLHRQVSKDQDLVELQDVPPLRMGINTLVRLAIRNLE